MTQYVQPMQERRWYRNRRRGWIAGVCAGLAEYLGVSLFWVRLLVLIPLLSPLMPLMVIGYLIATFVLPEAPTNRFTSQEHEAFWHKANTSPSPTYRSVGYKMDELEARLQQMEAYVTSQEYQVNDGLSKSIREA